MPTPGSGLPSTSLTALALDLVRQTDVDGLLRHLVLAVVSVTGLRHASAVLDGADGVAGRLACTGVGTRVPTVVGAPVAVGGPPPAPPATIRMSGPTANSQWQAAWPDGPAVQSLLGVWLFVDGQARGVVYGADERAEALDEADDRALNTLADFAGVALGHLDRFAAQRAEVGAAAARERERMRAHFIARVIDAQEAERARVARDLHDEIGQALTSVLLGLHLVDAAVTDEPVDQAEAARRTAEVREIVADALRSVRRLAFELRPTVLDDVGLVAALRRLVTDLAARYRTAVDMTVGGLTDEARLPPEVETVVYRVVQESLTNVVRHSGAATASVRIEHTDGVLQAVVADDGVGFDPQQLRTSLGLRGMEERAALVGGNLRLDSMPGHGAMVKLEVPVGKLEVPVG